MYTADKVETTPDCHVVLRQTWKLKQNYVTLSTPVQILGGLPSNVDFPNLDLHVSVLAVLVMERGIDGGKSSLCWFVDARAAHNPLCLVQQLAIGQASGVVARCQQSGARSDAAVLPS
ncbi:hypothetical protein CKAH01_08292 [Colletotrichum kahawae]|uniref:Uncharacterized protein n=1 Tax=Colletotrichum kahawae TaxID=34407 RepID=A0AAD9Y2W5_COLKA|nr:hypothetical protein CKAH01_08292 [Colletotrichum kahawae]